MPGGLVARWNRVTSSRAHATQSVSIGLQLERQALHGSLNRHRSARGPEGKSAVNEFLYDICKYTRTSEGDRVFEGERGGIREVAASLRAAGVAAPHFIDRGISFTVIVPRHALLPLDDVAWLAVNDTDHRLSATEGQIVSSMRNGQVWANSTVRAESPGIDSREAQRALAHLVDLDFAEAVGQGRGRQYKLHPRWQVAALLRRPKVSLGPPDVPSEQDPLPVHVPPIDLGSGRSRLGHDKRERSTRPAEVVLDALNDGPLTLRSMVGATGLSVSTVRYALRWLIGEQLVVINGGWGVKGTTYQRARPPAR